MSTEKGTTSFRRRAVGRGQTQFARQRGACERGAASRSQTDQRDVGDRIRIHLSASLDYNHVRGVTIRITEAYAILGLERITFDPQVKGGRACIRDLRITVSLILNLLANGMTKEKILRDLSLP